MLKSLILQAHYEVSTNGQLPSHLAMLALEQGHDARDGIFSCLPRVETMVGSYKLTEVCNGTVAKSDFEAEAAALPAREWDQVGRFMLSREISAYESWNADVIVGFQLGNYGRMNRHADRWYNTNIAFADDHVSYHRVDGSQWDDIEGIVAADRAARVELGLNEPPDYLNVIRAFIQEQKRR